MSAPKEKWKTIARPVEAMHGKMKIVGLSSRLTKEAAKIIASMTPEAREGVNPSELVTAMRAAFFAEHDVKSSRQLKMRDSDDSTARKMADHEFVRLRLADAIETGRDWAADKTDAAEKRKIALDALANEAHQAEHSDEDLEVIEPDAPGEPIPPVKSGDAK